MSSVLLIEPFAFGSIPEITDNSFMVAEDITAEKQRNDQDGAFGTLRQLRDRINANGVQARILRNADEPNAQEKYLRRGDAIFPNNYVSFHNFTDEEGRIVRRLVILYPMSLHRRAEAPQVQLLERLEAAAAEGKLELLDLRSYEEENRALEGTGALVFSPDGRYVYMSRSGRTDDDLLDLICAEQYLNIPRENRFLFSSAVPREDGGADLVYHTNVVGWCGKGIAAWAFDLLSFDSKEESAAFRAHMDREYDCVVDLSLGDIKAFGGNAFELTGRNEDGSIHRFVCMSATAAQNMCAKTREQLLNWYGEKNILSFPADMIERRTGGSIRCMMGASLTHGPADIAAGQQSTLDIAHVAEKK